MLGIVIPAHNEQAVIADCLAAVKTAAHHPGLHGEAVQILVVLDHCTDLTSTYVDQAQVSSLEIDARNVGVARALGAEAMLARGARWLAFTDADTQVAPAWLAEQLALQADAVCGTVEVVDWSDHGTHAELIRWHFGQTYTDADDHRHIHGANLGVSASAYRVAGGFQHLACSEDVALVEALQATGARIAWSARPRVITSARRVARARGGFADALLNAVANRLDDLASQPCGDFVR
ncbi:MAG: glycosyltransferase family 2 protein [Proteobacteria bacterium]|nr:MAG: glycosyltransferase family 2 protein [Pseudomonadota bacterium]